jgi:hypothetical protein
MIKTEMKFSGREIGSGFGAAPTVVAREAIFIEYLRNLDI